MTTVAISAGRALEARSAFMALALVVAASTAVRVGLATFMSAPWIVPDEIIYSELARSIADGHLPAVRGQATFALGPLYPLLIAPAWLFFDEPENAYRATLIVNALLMSLAALPAYALARMLVPRRKAILVAGFTVLVPSLAYTNVVMTENAFYPAFLLSVLAVARALVRPTVGRQALVLGSIALLVAVRVQGVGLAIAYIGSVLTYVAISPSNDRMRRLHAYRPSAYALAGLTAVVPVLSAASDAGPLGWLGRYSTAFTGLALSEVPRWLIFHIAVLALYVAVAPFVATVVVIRLGLIQRSSERLRLFSALCVSVIGAMLLTVVFVSASVDVDQHEVLNERYLFYVVPLFLIGLAIWVDEGLPRPKPLAWALVASSGLLIALIPYDRFSYNANHQALSLVPWVLISLPPLAKGVLAGTLALMCGWLWIGISSRKVHRVWMLVVWWFLFVGAIAVAAGVSASKISRGLGLGTTPHWIDSRVPAGAEVTIVWREPPLNDVGAIASRVVWLNEFFNRRVGPVLNVGRPTPDQLLPMTTVRMRRDGVLVGAGGRTFHPEYVLAICRLGAVGTELARDRSTGAVLLRATVPLRLRPSTNTCFGLYGREDRFYSTPVPVP